MDIAVGDIFALKAGAIDLTQYDSSRPDDPKAIIWRPGTLAIVHSIDDQHIWLQFPDGTIEPHDLGMILVFFNPVRDGKALISHSVTDFGTPPPELAAYLPSQIDWRKNYRYKVILEFEDRGLKSAICPRCLNDLGPSPEINDQGLKRCVKCDSFVLSIDPRAFGDIDDNESGTIPKSG